MKETEKKMEDVDKVVKNISHNRLLERNWERLKIIVQKKMHKDMQKAAKDK